MKEFKYYPESFGDLTVKVKHMDLDFDVYEEYTVVDSKLHVEVLTEISELDLNAKGLEVLELGVVDEGGKVTFLEYDYLEDENILQVKFGRNVEVGEALTIYTKTICRPTSNILEGLYYDETPQGCPCQQITQCQQWGFQRIVPCIDDMTAKCTYKTTITGDERYTNMISNGDVSVEVESVGEGRARIKYDNVITPMATYLFFLGLGTYATFEKEFVYPDGEKFMLELLVPPNSDAEIAEKALQVLHDSIMWVYLFTGPEKYVNWEKSLRIKELCERRESAREAGEAFEDVQGEIDVLCEGMNFGYRYTGTVYREIGMQNSDFGGMENVGNTTITTNRIMPFPEMTDSSFEYMVRVKVHEYYHNLNGSEVTGRSPFEIWLNEAVTVFIEQEYHEFLFGEDYSRLGSVLGFLYPGRGTFAGDDSATAMPIEPDGFNDPNELITGVTYVKAPEFVKMIETLMGEEVFVKGLDLYHTRYKHSNASRAQWVEAMEEATKEWGSAVGGELSFQRMAQVWLKQASYPKVDVSREVRGCDYVLKLKQGGFKEGMHWEFPFVAALCRADGSVIEEKMQRVMSPEEEIVFEGVAGDDVAFLSLNRGYGCFAKVFCDFSEEELYLSARKDEDLVGRFMSFYRLAEREKLRILEGGGVSEEFVDLYFEILSDGDLCSRIGSSMLAIFENCEDERFAHSYQKLYDAVLAIKKAIALKYEDELKRIYGEYTAMSFEGTYVEKEAQAIKAREVKNACLALLAKLDKEEVWEMLRSQFEGAQCATDKIVAFSLYINSSAPDKMELLRSYKEEVSGNLVSWESFLIAVARIDSEDFMDVILEIEKSEEFRIDQANDQRALYGVFAANRKKSLLTAKGRVFLRDRILKLAPVNEYSTLSMVKAFGNIALVDEEYREDLWKTLEEVQEGLDAKKTPSVANTVARILKAKEG